MDIFSCSLRPDEDGPVSIECSRHTKGLNDSKMCQEITIFAKFSYTFVFSILDFDFNFEPEDFELIAFFISRGVL